MKNENATQHTGGEFAALAALAALAGSAPLVNHIYALRHQRFGRAVVKVLRVDETWADCEIISGVLRGMGRGAVWEAGDTKKVRIEHGVWVPNDQALRPDEKAGELQ